MKIEINSINMKIVIVGNGIIYAWIPHSSIRGKKKRKEQCIAFKGN